MAPCEGTANEVLFEWSHQTLLSTDSNLRFTLQDLLFILGSHKYLRIMLESYFQPKIRKEHEENKNVQPRAKKKKRHSF